VDVESINHPKRHESGRGLFGKRKEISRGSKKANGDMNVIQVHYEHV
jgi:hypothetical protein